MAFDSRYYHDPAGIVEVCRKNENRLLVIAERKAYRGANGCEGCQRYDKGLRACRESQKPHSGGFCGYWWDDRSHLTAPEVM